VRLPREKEGERAAEEGRRRGSTARRRGAGRLAGEGPREGRRRGRERDEDSGDDGEEQCQRIRRGPARYWGQMSSRAMNTAWYWVGIPIPNSKPPKQLVFRAGNANADSKPGIQTSKSKRYLMEFLRTIQTRLHCSPKRLNTDRTVDFM